MSATIHDRLVAGLEALGNLKAKPGSHRFGAKYTIIARTNKGGNWYFVGRAGALRTGKSPVSSVPCHNEFRRRVLERGDEALRASGKVRLPANAPELTLGDLKTALSGEESDT